MTACARDEERVRASSVSTDNRDIALNAWRVGKEWFPWPVPVVRGGLKYLRVLACKLHATHLKGRITSPQPTQKAEEARGEPEAVRGGVINHH